VKFACLLNPVDTVTLEFTPFTGYLGQKKFSVGQQSVEDWVGSTVSLDEVTRTQILVPTGIMSVRPSDCRMATRSKLRHKNLKSL
jgi:hypothetical protein